MSPHPKGRSREQPRDALPSTSSSARVPWAVALGSTAVAVGALSMLLLRPSPAHLKAEIARLNAQVEALQEQLPPNPNPNPNPNLRPNPSHSEWAHPDPERRPAAPKPAAAGPSAGEVGAGASDDARIERLVEERLEVRDTERRADAARAIEAPRERALAQGSDAISAAVDRWVAVEGSGEEVAGAVQELLEAELDETWQIKEATVLGDLAEADALADWKALRQETDANLLELLEPEQWAGLREDLGRGSK